jgi:hypothetical protein
MSDENRDFWNNFLRAVQTEARPIPSIPGASGIEHPLLALGVDDARKRLVLISGENDPRASAMMQTDIQSTMPGTHVVVARPIAVGLPIIAQRLIEALGTPTITMDVINKFQQGDPQQNMTALLQAIVPPATAFKAFQIVPLDILSQVLYSIRQLTYVDVQMAVNAVTGQQELQHFDVSGLASQDLMRLDREVGVCPLPLYTHSQTMIGVRLKLVPRTTWQSI